MIFCRPGSLQLDCMYETSQTKVFATPSDYVRNLKKELQTSQELVRDTMNVEQERQKTYYDRKQYGPKYNVNDIVLFFNRTLGKGQTKKMKSFYNGPHIIKKIVYDLKFVIEDQKSKKQQKVHYDRLNVFRERTKTNAQDKNKRGRKD